MKPVIGVTAVWSTEMGLCGMTDEFDYVACSYTQALRKAGGIPVLMPPPKDTETDLDAYADEILNRLDGVYFPVAAIESTEKTFVIGTQFHPEMMIYDPRAEKVLQAYIAAAKAYSERK